MKYILQQLKFQDLEVNVFEDRTFMGLEAANDVAECIHELLKTKSEINIIFAAAPSQNDFLLSLLVQDIPWEKINAFHSDEYADLEAYAVQRFGNFLRARIFGHLPFKSVNYLNGSAENSRKETERYAALLEQYPVDIVCMGIGENGHIAFNDPPVADFNDPLAVKRVKLDQICRQQQVNDGCFAKLNEVPKEALTLTIPALLKADHIFVIVPGNTKSAAVYRTLYDPIGEACPATVLRNHRNSKLYLDRESSSLLQI